MRHQGTIIEAGSVIQIMHAGVRTPWVVSDWSEGTGEIFGRREGGPYEKLPVRDPCPPPPPAPLTREEVLAERRRAREERKAHLAARDECIRQIRERDLRDGIVTISSGPFRYGRY
jgi:hypothetical protein